MVTVNAGSGSNNPIKTTRRLLAKQTSVGVSILCFFAGIIVSQLIFQQPPDVIKQQQRHYLLGYYNDAKKSSAIITTTSTEDKISATTTTTTTDADTNTQPVAAAEEPVIAHLVKKQQERNFKELAEAEKTDKVKGTLTLPSCLEDESNCPRPEALNRGCKVLGHFYDSMYQKWLGPFSRDDAEPFQFLEIGYFRGYGFDAFSKFLPNAELHSIEISCLEPGHRNEGKWPYGNTADKNPRYQELLDSHRLHCGDASSFDFLHHIWTTYMKRAAGDSPPLKVVIDDASHESHHMIKSVFFWLPRLEPGGLMIVEDIESPTPANKFRTEFLPQLMKDLHYCGLKEENKGPEGSVLGFHVSGFCLPTLQPLIKSIHCEMHICVFERNDVPAIEYDKKQSTPPPNALNSKICRN